MQCPRAALFDLDDTLAESFKAPTPAMQGALRKLLSRMPVAIITGASFERMRQQFLDGMADDPNISRLFIFSNSSALLMRYDGAWKETYRHSMGDQDRMRVEREIRAVVAADTGLSEVPHFGEQFVNREAQVSYTHVGIDAPFEVKISWDPDGLMRLRLCDELKKRLPEFEILTAGRTTIDVTQKGVDKAYGVRWLAEHLNIQPSEMLYVADALYEGGNDFVVIPTGVSTRPVSGPDETATVIEELLACSS